MQCKKCKIEVKKFYGSIRLCRDCFRNYQRLNQYRYRKIVGSYAWFHRRFVRVRTSAKLRNISFKLSFEKFKKLKIESRCFYCHIKVKIITIDRSDNNIGYTDENCVAACRGCNTIKSNKFSVAEMIILGKALHKINLQRARQIN